MQPAYINNNVPAKHHADTYKNPAADHVENDKKHTKINAAFSCDYVIMITLW